VGTLEDDPFAGAGVLGVLDEDDRSYLAQRSRLRRVGKGQIVFCEGDPSDSVLVLLSGQMKVVTYSQDGVEFIVNTVLPGETVGEIGMLSRGTRSATVQATEPCSYLTLASSVVIDLIAERPALAIAMLERLSNMVRRLTDVASDLVHLDLAQRVAKYLLSNSGGDGEDATVGVTQSDLAANIGASRQRVNSCLREFQRKGWIAMESRRLQVLDERALIGILAV
jgi:CRP/FNR family cyclic AMP-dependent transcriptional regulator